MGVPNKKTRITASAIGALLGLAGALNHGLFEILQGNKSTGGFFIEAIAEEHRFWVHGTEGAVTVIHNYLITGIAAVVVGLAVIVWSIRFIHAKHGASVFLLLMIALTLVGGGIGHIVVFVPTWAFATRINSSLDWWRRTLPARLRQRLSGMWIYFLSAALIFWLTVMELGVFGYFPSVQDPDVVLSIVLAFLLLSVLVVCMTFVCAIAADIEDQRS